MKKNPAPQKHRKAVTASRKPFPWLVVTVVLVVVAAAAWYFLSQGSKQQAYPQEVSVAEAYNLYQKGAFMLDVREQVEWETVHIPEATLVPLGSLPDKLDLLPKDAEIVVVCRSGNRSATGRDILRQAGFTTVTSMAGGMNQWQAAGYPTASGP